MKDLLQSLTKLSEGDVVHKGEYGNKYGKEDVRDQYGHKIGKRDKGEEAKKEAPKKGRGRPKKDTGDTGAKFDSSELNNVFGGKKPKKEVGKVSKKHSLKEYMESVEDTKNAEAVFESIMEGVDHTSIANNLAKLAKVIQSVQTPEQFAVAQKYAQRMSGAIQQHQHAGMGFGSGLRANIGVSRDIQSDLKAKAKELGIQYQALEETGNQISIEPAQQNTQVIKQGNNVLGQVTNPQLAAQIKQAIGQGQMTLGGAHTDQDMAEGRDEGKPGKNFAKIAAKAGKKYGSKEAGERVAGAIRNKIKAQGNLEEKAPPGDKAERMVKHIKASYAKDGKLTDKEKAIAYATAWKAHNKGQVEEGKAKPDFLDVDKDGNKKETFKKAVKDKKKVSESVQLTEAAMKDLATDFIEGLRVNRQGYNIMPAVDLNDVRLAKKTIRNTLAHDDRYKRLSHTLKNQLEDYALEEFGFTDYDQSLDEADIRHGDSESIRAHTQHALKKPTSYFSHPGQKPGAMTAPRGTPTEINRPAPNPTPWSRDPIAAATDRTFNFIDSLKKKTPFSESTDMKDLQLESWEKQLKGLLNEGITVSSSQGQEGSPNSVSVTATDADADSLMSVLRNAGIGGFGAEPETPEIGYGVAQGGEDEFDGTGTEPQPSPDVVGDGDDMLSLIKKLAGGGDAEVVAVGGEEGGQDYEDEEGSEEGGEEPQTLEPADGEEESGEESDEEGSEEDDGEEETTDEGNAFTGKLKQTPQGGNFKMGDKSYKDTSSIEEAGAGGGDEEEETCESCGHSPCDCSDEEQVEENWSNTPGGNAMGDSELAQLKALLTMGGDLHKQKSSQAVGNPIRVAESEISDWKKLSGIK